MLRFLEKGSVRTHNSRFSSTSGSQGNPNAISAGFYNSSNTSSHISKPDFQMCSYTQEMSGICRHTLQLHSVNPEQSFRTVLHRCQAITKNIGEAKMAAISSTVSGDRPSADTQTYCPHHPARSGTCRAGTLQSPSCSERWLPSARPHCGRSGRPAIAGLHHQALCLVMGQVADHGGQQVGNALAEQKRCQFHPLPCHRRFAPAPTLAGVLMLSSHNLTISPHDDRVLVFLESFLAQHPKFRPLLTLSLVVLPGASPPPLRERGDLTPGEGDSAAQYVPC